MKQSKKKAVNKKKTTRRSPRKSTLKKNAPPTKIGGGFLRSLFGGNWPQVNLSETAKSVKIVANLPGVDPNKIEVDVSDSLVRISGSTQEERQEKGEKFFHFERQYGEFSRDILLPAKIDTRKVTANSNHGVLTITLKKIEADTPRKLTVKKKKK